MTAENVKKLSAFYCYSKIQYSFTWTCHYWCFPWAFLNCLVRPKQVQGRISHSTCDELKEHPLSAVITVVWGSCPPAAMPRQRDQVNRRTPLPGFLRRVRKAHRGRAMWISVKLVFYNNSRFGCEGILTQIVEGRHVSEHRPCHDCHTASEEMPIKSHVHSPTGIYILYCWQQGNCSAWLDRYMDKWGHGVWGCGPPELTQAHIYEYVSFLNKKWKSYLCNIHM
jgi:hypothetical protein